MEGMNIQELLDIRDIPGAAEGEEIVVYQKLELVPVNSNPKDRKEDLERDYDLARQTNHYQNQMIMDMAKIALENAKNSDSPKHVEAFTSLMAQLTNANNSFMRIHKEMKEITEEKTVTTPPEQTKEPSMNIENATVFVGSPTELMDRVGSAYDSKNSIIEGELDG
ncbi:terminase small subunit [Pectobacterium phage POP12]|nr:terminase small subunit [Pectobacterium phage POP12]